MVASFSMEYPGEDLEAMIDVKNLYSWILSEIRVDLCGKTAEVGAGRGNFTTWLLSESIDKIYAFEPSKNMFSLLKDKFSSMARVIPVNGILIEYLDTYQNQFDTMVYINVLEHVYDDKKELDCIFKCLKPEGKLILFVPALSFLLSEYDRKIGHHRRYHKGQLVDLVANVGFKLIQVKYIDFLGIIPWFIYMVMLKKELDSRKASLYDAWMIPIVRNIEKIIHPPVGRNLLLIAQKIK